MKTRILKYAICLVATISGLMAVSSCSDNDEPETEKKGRTVLVYMVANNNLSSFGNDDYEEMLEGARAGIGEDNHLLIYRHSRGAGPELVSITASGAETVKSYGTEESSVAIARMAEVIKEVKRITDTEQYGLVLWSHGSGWVNDGIEKTASKRSFGDDAGRRMNNSALRKALLEAGGVDWIYFDCCYMMSIETLYELRSCTRRFAGSVTELQTPGMPYHLNLKYFFAPGEADLVGAAKSTFEYYEARIAEEGDVMNNYCTMSVVNSANLGRVAKAAQTIYAKANPALPEGSTPQMYSNVRESACKYFDFADYAGLLTHDAAGVERYAGSTADLKELKAAIGMAVEYDAATPMLRRLPINSHCGMSTYVLRNGESYKTEDYGDLSWYRDVASVLKF